MDKGVVIFSIGVLLISLGVGIGINMTSQASTIQTIVDVISIANNDTLDESALERFDKLKDIMDQNWFAGFVLAIFSYVIGFLLLIKGMHTIKPS